MSSHRIVVERPLHRQDHLSNVASTLQVASLLASERLVNSTVPIVNVGTIQCLSEPAAKFSEGKLSDGNGNEAKIRIKIRPSFFIVETSKEYTIEEISTKSLNKLVKRRVRDIQAFSAEFQPAPSKRSRRKILQCDEDTGGNKVIMESSASSLESMAELLPVIINIHDWALHEEEEIRIDLKGNQGMEELVNVSHMNPEDWELDRLNALILDHSKGVYYARHGILDVVVTHSHVTGQPLRQPVIFRLVDVNMWIITPLQLAIPKYESMEKREKYYKVLYQHPSLTNIEDLKSMASKSLSVSSVLIPEISKFNPAEIELINAGAEKLHYFTAQGVLGKKNVTLDELIRRHYQIFNSAQYITSSNTTTITTTTPLVNEKMKAQAILSSRGKSLDTIATSISLEYDTNRPRNPTPPASPVQTTTTPPPTAFSNLSQTSLRNPITCFFGPDYSSITSCISLAGYLKMHIFFSALDNASINRTFVANADNSVMEIHKSGRFVDLTPRNTIFLPDLDIDTLKVILKDTTGTTSATIIASLLFYNNVNLSEGRAVSQSGSEVLSNVIVDLFSGESFKLVGEVAREVASIYRFQDNCDAILFPKNNILSGRRSYNRQYRWHDPISCVVGLYSAVMDTFIKTIRKGETVSVDDSALAYMHNQVLKVVLTPFFEAILKTGAWAIKEVRSFARHIVESILLKYSSSEEYHAAFFLGQPILDVMARLVVHFLIMESAAENEGVCTVFHKDPPFIIEPDIPLDRYILSTTPGYIMKGENVAERIKVMVSAKYNEREQVSSKTTTPVRTVAFPIPSGRFLKSNKDFKVLLTVPDKLDAGVFSTPSEIISSPELLLNYTPPKILYVNLKYTAENGFEELRQKGVLTSTYNVTKKFQEKARESIDVENEIEAEGVRTGFSVDGKLEHISAFLPGSSAQPVPEDLSVNSTKQAKYFVKELGMETVFFEPLLSSAALQNAAKSKTTRLNSLKVYKECISPLLNNGKILIFPKNSETLAGDGFDFLWKCSQERYGYNTTLEKLQPKAPVVKLIDPNDNNDVLMKSETGIQAFLLTAIKHFQSKKYASKNSNNEVAALSSSTSPPSVFNSKPKDFFTPTFLDIDLFLRHHFKGVITTLISRLMMVVSNVEMKIIKSVSENICKLLIDSFYVSIDPEAATANLFERIESEQNGISLDKEGVGYDTLRYAVTGRIFISEGDTPTALLNEPLATVPNELRALFEKLRSIGEQQQPPAAQQQQTNSNNINPSSTTTEDIAYHNEQLKKIKDSSLLTAKLLRLIRDDTRKDRITKNITETMKVYKRTPQILMATKPISPVFTSKSVIPSNFIATDQNFSTSQDLFIPVNPRDLLTDVQWLHCMSIIETATRDSAMNMSHLQSQADNTLTQLKDILKEWETMSSQVTSENSPAFLSALRLDWLNHEVDRIASVRENAEKSKVALIAQGKIVNLDSFGMVAVARSLLDIDFYIKLPNVWSTRDWRGLLYSAVSIASIPLNNNIARGVMAASQTAFMYNSSIYLSSAEQTIRNISF